MLLWLLFFFLLLLLLLLLLLMLLLLPLHLRGVLTQALFFAIDWVNAFVIQVHYFMLGGFQLSVVSNQAITSVLVLLLLRVEIGGVVV